MVVALAAAARAAAPGLIAADILDCGAAAGYALDALRSGQRVLVLAPSCPARAAVVSAAAGIGATGARSRAACPGYGGSPMRRAGWRRGWRGRDSVARFR